MGIGVVVGPVIDKEGMEAYRDAILAILETDNDQATKQVALNALTKGVEMEGGNNNQFHECDFDFSEETKEDTEEFPS